MKNMKKKKRKKRKTNKERIKGNGKTLKEREMEN